MLGIVRYDCKGYTLCGDLGVITRPCDGFVPGDDLISVSNIRPGTVVLVVRRYVFFGDSRLPWSTVVLPTGELPWSTVVLPTGELVELVSDALETESTVVLPSGDVAEAR